MIHAPPQPAPIQTRLLTGAAFALLAVVALLPRLIELGGFVTVDESNYWFTRSEQFLVAIQSGHPADTAIRPHPGVTTMWLGSAGVLLRQFLLENGLVEAMPYALLLTLMRLPAVLVHTLGVLLGYVLLRRLLPATIAFLGALLWAADPFLIGYSRVLHLDALAATFATLSLLAACAFWYHHQPHWTLALSAICAALAALSKIPALALLPLIGLAALLAPRNGGPVYKVRELLLWGGIFGVTIVLVWPAVWADPERVAVLMQASVAEEGGQPHLWGNYFLGQIEPVPGPTFYPVAVALRLTPWTLAGVLLLPFVWHQARDLPNVRRTLLLLVLFTIFFVLAMSLFPKKLNRYMVPIFPALDILAAAGLVWGAAMLQQWLTRFRALPAALTEWATVALVGVLAVGNTAYWHPYAVTAFNQAFGGAPAGAATFAIGWGEGLDQVSTWLQQQPDITGVTVASTMINSFQPLLPRGIQSVSPDPAEGLSEQVGYVAIYVQDVQRAQLEPPFDRFYAEETPLHVVTIHDVDYAWIYQVPPRLAHTVDAIFQAPDSALRLSGYTLDSTTLRTTGTISVTLQWQTNPTPAADYLLFTHLLTPAGQLVGQVDAPPSGPTPTTAWQPGRAITYTYPLFVPADLPPGNYWLSLGLYQRDDPTFARLPLQATAPADAPDDGPHALLLPLTIEAVEAQDVQGGADS